VQDTSPNLTRCGHPPEHACGSGVQEQPPGHRGTLTPWQSTARTRPLHRLPSPHPHGGPGISTLGTSGCIVSRGAWVPQNVGLDCGSRWVALFFPGNLVMMGARAPAWRARRPALLLPTRLLAGMSAPAPDPSFPADSGQSVSRDLLVSEPLLPSRRVGWYESLAKCG